MSEGSAVENPLIRHARDRGLAFNQRAAQFAANGFDWVFRRRRLEGQSREEIAQALGLQPEAVKKHISRAMAQLARALDEAEGAQ